MSDEAQPGRNGHHYERMYQSNGTPAAASGTPARALCPAEADITGNDRAISRGLAGQTAVIGTAAAVTGELACHDCYRRERGDP
jgi:hypothetical protein